MGAWVSVSQVMVGSSPRARSGTALAPRCHEAAEDATGFLLRVPRSAGTAPEAVVSLG